MELYIGQNLLDRVHCPNFLRMFIDERLDLHEQIQLCKSEITIGLPSIKKRYFIQSPILICIMVIYFGAQHTRVIPSDLLFHKTAIRIITRVKYNDHKSPIFKKYCILKLQDIHNIQLGKAFLTIFTINDDVHSYATRQKKYFYLPLTKFDYIMLCFLYRGPKLCLELPQYVKEAKSVSSYNTVRIRIS